MAAGTIDEQIERAALIAAKTAGTAWPLSTSETLAAALVLNRPDVLAGDTDRRAWTLAEALERLGPDWIAAVPRVARRLADQGVL